MPGNNGQAEKSSSFKDEDEDFSEASNSPKPTAAKQVHADPRIAMERKSSEDSTTSSSAPRESSLVFISHPADVSATVAKKPTHDSDAGVVESASQTTKVHINKVDASSNAGSPPPSPQPSSAQAQPETMVPTVRVVATSLPANNGNSNSKSTVAASGASLVAKGRNIEDRQVARHPHSVQFSLGEEEGNRDAGIHNINNRARGGGGGSGLDDTAKRQGEVYDVDSEEDDYARVAAYVFPRIDPALAHSQHSSSRSSGEGGELDLADKDAPPPNCCEKFIASLLYTDSRVACYFGVLFLCLVFTIVSIPISQLDGLERTCYTYWGYKDNCDAAEYTTSVSLITCSPVKTRLQAGAAFSIMTLIIFLVAFIASIILIFCLDGAPQPVSWCSRWVIGGLGIGACFTQLVSWAVIAGIYTSKYCLLKGQAYGVGFGFCITSWFLNLVGVVLLLSLPSKLFS